MGEVINLWVRREERKRERAHIGPGQQLECGTCGCHQFFVYRVGGETVVLCWDCDSRVMTFWDA